MNFKIDPRTALSGATLPIEHKNIRQLEKLKESAKELEVHFLNEMMKAMRKTVPESELFDKNSAEKIYEEMQDKEFAKAMSDSHDIGIASAIYNQMAPLIENRINTTHSLSEYQKISEQTAPQEK